MQALDLLPSAPVSTNGAEQSPATNLRGPATSDDEFGRMMERAMSPGAQDRPDTHPTPRKEKTSTTSARNHASKAQADQKATATTSDTTTDKTGGCDKAQKASDQSAEPAATSKEKAAADTATTQPVTGDDVIEPLPVFLSLPLMSYFANGGTDVKTTATTGKAPSTALVSAIGAEKTPAADLIGKNPTITQSEKSIQPGALSAISDNKPPTVATPTAPLVAEAKTAKTDAKSSLPTATEITSQIASQPEPAKAESAVSADLKAEAATLGDDKSQVIAPTAAKAPGASKNDGTGVAITASSMKKTENTNKVAGFDVQVLPGGKTDAAQETVLPAHAAVAPVRASDKQTSDLNFPLPSTSPATADTAETTGIITLPSLAEARMRDVERTHDLVSLHALRMVEAKADSLQVVIKPGGGTELSLELRHRNGTLEAEAVLQRGDFQLLNQHWPELQQKLEQRGIKLAPLGGDTNFSAPDNGNFSRQQQSAREEAAQKASAFAEFSVAINRGGATARLAPVTAGGWESWA